MRKQRGRNIYWGAVILDTFKALQDARLRGIDYKVLFYLCSEMKADDNKAFVKQKQIAEALRCDKGNISKAIKHLCELQFIAKAENGFMINPHLFYVGKPDHLLREKRYQFDDLVTSSSEKKRFNFDELESKLEIDEESL